MWLDRGHGQMDFYLIRVMPSHGAFNTYLFYVKLEESPKSANCDRRGWDDDVWYTLFECPAFQLSLHKMNTLQEMGELPLTPDSLVPIMLISVEGWDHKASFVPLTIYHKTELARE